MTTLYTAADMAKPTNHAKENMDTSSAGALVMTPAETRKPGMFGRTPATNAASAAGFHPSCADTLPYQLLAAANARCLENDLRSLSYLVPIGSVRTHGIQRVNI